MKATTSKQTKEFIRNLENKMIDYEYDAQDCITQIENYMLNNDLSSKDKTELQITINNLFSYIEKLEEDIKNDSYLY